MKDENTVNWLVLMVACIHVLQLHPVLGLLSGGSSLHSFCSKNKYLIRTKSQAYQLGCKKHLYILALDSSLRMWRTHSRKRRAVNHQKAKNMYRSGDTLHTPVNLARTHTHPLWHVMHRTWLDPEPRHRGKKKLLLPDWDQHPLAKNAAEEYRRRKRGAISFPGQENAELHACMGHAERRHG